MLAFAHCLHSQQSSTHEKRQGSKDENKRIAMQLMRDSRRLDGEERKAEVAKAYQYFQRVGVTWLVHNHYRMRFADTNTLI